MRILLAEDDEKLNETLVYGLTQAGMIVDACFDGEDALFYEEQIPLALEELLARIRCVARRPRRIVDEETLALADIVLLPAENRLTGPAGSCTLSRREAALLETVYKTSSALSS